MIVSKTIFRVGWLLIGLLVTVFLLMVFEGPDRHYSLDANYQMWGWPGWIMKNNPEYKTFIDPVEFESGIENKQHYHSTNFINKCLMSDNPFKRRLCESTFQHQKKHLSYVYKLYYTNSPHTNIPLFCMDIDPITEKDEPPLIPSTPEDMQKAAQFLSVLHRNI